MTPCDLGESYQKVTQLSLTTAGHLCFSGQRQERQASMLLRKLTRESVWSRVCGGPLSGWWCS